MPTNTATAKKAKSVRITEPMRRSLCKRIMKASKVQQDMNEVRASMYAAAEALRVSLLGGPEGEQKIKQCLNQISKMQQTTLGKVMSQYNIAESLVNMRSQIYVYDENSERGGRAYRFSKDECRVVPTNIKRSELTKAQLKWLQVYEAEDKTEDELYVQLATQRREVMDMLYSFNTSRQLREHWPEINKQLDETLAEFNKDDAETKRVPVVQITKINETVGLPTDA